VTAIAGYSFRSTEVAPWLAWVDQLTSTFGNYPLDILPKAAGFLLTFVFPLGFVAYLPAAAVTGHAAQTGLPAWVAGCAPALGPIAFVCAKRLWERNLRAYTGTNG
jgi:ABC-2 type transport system permease protein